MDYYELFCFFELLYFLLLHFEHCFFFLRLLLEYFHFLILHCYFTSFLFGYLLLMLFGYFLLTNRAVFQLGNISNNSFCMHLGCFSLLHTVEDCSYLCFSEHYFFFFC